MKNPVAANLRLSLAVILLVWLQDLVRNLFFVDATFGLYQSIPKFLVLALAIGILYVLLVTLLLRLSGEKYADIGFSGRKPLHQFATGALSGLAIFILHTFLLSPVISALLPKTAMQGIDPARLFHRLIYLPILLLLTSFKGGFSEEVWRFFVLTRFRRRWGKKGLIVALIAGSAIFGLGHLYQGVGSMLSVSIVGFLYSLVYLRKGRAWEAIAAHGTFDILAVVIGFILYYGK
jgi:uncharacterized protein